MSESCEKMDDGKVYAFLVSLPPFPVYVRGASSSEATHRLMGNLDENISICIEHAMEAGELELDEAAIFHFNDEHRPTDYAEPVF